jgi:hypothetical protein
MAVIIAAFVFLMISCLPLVEMQNRMEELFKSQNPRENMTAVQEFLRNRIWLTALAGIPGALLVFLACSPLCGKPSSRKAEYGRQ